MNKSILATLSALSLLLVAGCATTTDKPPTPDKTATATQQPADLEIRDKITATAIVQAVDLEKREVVLKGKSGKLHTIKVGEEVRNLPQVKVGDRVVLTYYEALAVNLQKDTTGGVAMRKESVTADRAELGQKPAGAIRKDVEIIANVTGLNKKTRRVTLQGAQDAVTLKAPEDIDISKLKVGDQVKANYVQELAISVEAAGTKKKK